GQTYGGEQAAAAPEFHPLLPLHIELQQARLEEVQGRLEQAGQRLHKLHARGQRSGGHMLSVTALCQHLAALLAGDARQAAGELFSQALEA
ncbi:MAG: helix-turn-helix transcriptional regulator, partial [Pseudomonas sp.]